MSLFYRFAYRAGYKPWDSGVAPPELRAAVEGPGALAPGRALDLGCGTGTNSVYLAEQGWRVTGVDLVPRAIAAARRRAVSAGVWPRLLTGDVSRLHAIDVGDGYRLLLDIGCFHGLPAGRRDAYVAGVTLAAEPGATFLLFGILPEARRARFLPRGTGPDEVQTRFAGWELERADPGRFRRFPTCWYRLRRR